MHELSLTIANKRCIWSDRGMSSKRNAILAYLSWYEMHNSEALQKILVVYPYPLEFDNLRYMQMRPISEFQNQWGGINGANVVNFARCWWYWYILSFEIHFSPANHLKSNPNRSFERLKLFQKHQKLTKKKKKKSAKSEFTISWKKTLL